MSVMTYERNLIVPKPRPKIAKAVAELQMLQRKRSIVMKSRIMMCNRLQAVVAGTMGYSSGLDEKKRQKLFGEASQLIKRVEAGESDHPLKSVILASMRGVYPLLDEQARIEKEMLRFVKMLHVVKWVEHIDQRGFGLAMLGIIIGETGCLSNYANPGKLWRRMGCAPYTFDGQTWMGATWRGGKHGKLPAEEWEEFGYSPRRRSIAYLIGEGMVKQNQGGPYRSRYDDKKAELKRLHPDYSDMRCHLHGMLLATKLLLKNLWIEWNK